MGKTERKSVHQRFQAHLGKGPFPASSKGFDPALAGALPGAGTRWKVAILQQEDWNAIFVANGLSRRYKLNTAESALIRLYKPKYNVTSHPDRTRPLPWVKNKAESGE